MPRYISIAKAPIVIIMNTNNTKIMHPEFSDFIVISRF